MNLEDYALRFAAILAKRDEAEDEAGLADSCEDLAQLAAELIGRVSVLERIGRGRAE